eukprot:2270867-Prymnesium_polylepis.1
MPALVRCRIVRRLYLFFRLRFCPCENARGQRHCSPDGRPPLAPLAWGASLCDDGLDGHIRPDVASELGFQKRCS